MINETNAQFLEPNEQDMRQDVFFVVEDDSGVTHRLKVLTIFTAGKLNHQYVAGITTDIMLYRYLLKMQGESEYKIYIEEIATEEEFGEAIKVWEKIAEDDISNNELREETVYMEVSEGDEVYEHSMQATILRIFETNGINAQRYIALCPHIIMFYKYNVSVTAQGECVEISRIYSPQEYDDVSEQFNLLMDM